MEPCRKYTAVVVCTNSKPENRRAPKIPEGSRDCSICSCQLQLSVMSGVTIAPAVEKINDLIAEKLSELNLCPLHIVLKAVRWCKCGSRDDYSAIGNDP